MGLEPTTFCMAIGSWVRPIRAARQHGRETIEAIFPNTPDGNIYIAQQGANAIARLNPATRQATDIPVPTPNSTRRAAPSARTARSGSSSELPTRSAA
jgi:streptogramin lyase